MPLYRDNVQMWHDRADEARIQAEQMNNAEARLAMPLIAASYDRMARRAQDKLAEQKP